MTYKDTQQSHLTIDFFEHPIHVLQVVVVQEPHGVIPVIFVEWYCT